MVFPCVPPGVPNKRKDKKIKKNKLKGAYLSELFDVDLFMSEDMSCSGGLWIVDRGRVDVVEEFEVSDCCIVGGRE